jgi:hypothetical protein
VFCKGEAVKKTTTLSIPMFVHVPDNQYIDSQFSEEAFDKVIQWATAWSKTCDSSIAGQAQNVLQALSAFLHALDKKGRERAQDSAGSPYLAGLLGQAEAILAEGSAIKRNGKAGTKPCKK